MTDFLFRHTHLAFFSQSFWRDEAFSYLMAKQNVAEILITTAKDFSPPLYYVFLHVWMKIAGTSEIALRLPSLLFFYATIYIVDHYLTDVIKIKTRWRYAYLLLIFINPFLNYYAYEARMYTMFAFLATLSFYAFKTNNKKLHVLSSVLGLFTHYFMIFVLLGQFIFALTHKKLRSAMPSFTYIATSFAPWVLFVLLIGTAAGDSFWIQLPTYKTVLRMPAVILTGYEEALYLSRFAIHPLTFLIIGVTMLAWFRQKKHKNNHGGELWYLALWSFLPAIAALLISTIKPIYLPRYFIFSSVGLTLLLSYGLHYSRPLPRKILFVAIVFLLIHYNYHQIHFRKKGDVRSVIAEIKSQISSDDLIYVESELDFHTVQYYFSPSRVFIYRKPYKEIPSYVGKVLIPSSHITSNLPAFPKKAFILHGDLSYDVQSTN